MLFKKLAAFAAFLLLAVSLQVQAARTITGALVDPYGVGLDSAVLSFKARTTTGGATGLPRGASASTTLDASGTYSLSVQAGTYDIKITYPDGKRVTLGTKVTVTEGTAADLGFILGLGVPATTPIQSLLDEKIEGPALSTDNAIARFSGTGGKLAENSAITIDDSGNMATAGTVDGRDISTDGAAQDSHLADDTKHRLINDAGTSATELWSASKIAAVDAATNSALTTHTGDTANPHTVTLANAGVGGVSVVDGATAGGHELRSINTGSARLTVTNDAANNEIDLDVAEAAIVHQNISGAGTNAHAQIDTHIGDDTKHRLINDAGTAATELWSASKIAAVDAATNSALTTHTSDDTKHRLINDAGTAATELWSASKITAVDAATNSALTTHTSDTANPHTVTAAQINLGNVPNLKQNLIATTAPTATDDTGAGYAVGSYWFDTTADKAYTCLDATSTAAVWIETTSAGGSGEVNTASNTGAGGVGVFDTKAAEDLQFKNINTGSARLTVTNDAANNEIDLDVAEAAIVHQNISGAGTNTHTQIDTHIADDTKHRLINDAGTAATELWSASKIAAVDAATNSALTTHTSDTANPHAVTATQVNLGNVPNLKQNLTATTVPTATDDTGAGYSVGSYWFDVTADKAYTCLDATSTAAVWIETTSAGTAYDESAVAITGGNIDGTVIGATTPAAATVSTFTSTGIDDNATTNQFTITDTAATFGGNLNLGDNQSVYLGAGNDMEFYHNGSSAFLFNITGNFNIRANSNSGLVYLGSKNSVGTYKTGVEVGGATPSVKLHYDGVEALGTMSGGASFGGDANFKMFMNGANPNINYDSQDYFVYQRALDQFRLYLANVQRFQLDDTATAGNTALSIYDVDNAALGRVTVGAADSCGTGFKCLRIPN